MGCHNGLHSLTNRDVFLTIVEPEKAKIKVPEDWPAEGHCLTVSSHGGERDKFSGVSFYKGTNPIIKVPSRLPWWRSG